MANLLTRVPKRSQPGVAIPQGPVRTVRTIYQQLSPAKVHAQTGRVVSQLRERFPQAANMLEDAAPNLLAFTAFPVSLWQKLWSNNPPERLNKEIRRRRACPCRGRGGYVPQPFGRFQRQLGGEEKWRPSPMLQCVPVRLCV